MKSVLITILVIFPLLSQAQDMLELSYLDHLVIDNNLFEGDNHVGGLSGITYNTDDDHYYLVSDKYPARLIKVKIEYTDSLTLNIVDELILYDDRLINSELEGIAYDFKNSNFYLADEQSQGTRIFLTSKEGDFIKLIYPSEKEFVSLSAKNSGIEGLTIAEDCSELIYAFERPEIDCDDKKLTRIGRINTTELALKGIYYYPLHSYNEEHINNNGISEILYLGDNNLLIMERAYIPGKGNVVRLYHTILEISKQLPPGSSCTEENIQPLDTKLVFDFSSVDSFKIDNAEGMCFNNEMSLLFIITDNNFSGRQQTQLVVLKVN